MGVIFKNRSSSLLIITKTIRGVAYLVRWQDEFGLGSTDFGVEKAFVGGGKGGLNPTPA